LNTSYRSKKRQPDVLPDQMATALADALRPAELANEQRERMRGRMLEYVGASGPAGTVTQRRDEAQWVKAGRYIEIRELERDAHAGTHVSLVRMHPGATVPAHRHSKDELFFILEGECHIGSHLLRAGDMHFAETGSEHDVITTQTGVLVLVHGEYPYPSTHTA